MNIETKEQHIRKYLEKAYDPIILDLITQIIEYMKNSYPKNEDLSYIYISFLRSSILDNSPIYRLDFYDQQGRLDTRGYSHYWDIPKLREHCLHFLHPIDIEQPHNLVLKDTVIFESELYEYYELFHDVFSRKIQSNISISSLHENDIDYVENIVFHIGDLWGDTLEFKIYRESEAPL